MITTEDIKELSHKDKAQLIIDLLSNLIVSHCGMMASEQYSPNPDADRSDDIIKERREWVKELRHIRERFETLVTGVVT